MDAAVAAHLLGVHGSFVLKKNSIDGLSRRVQCFAILLIGLGKKCFWAKQQCIAALCGALTRISCRPLQPLETSSCYQVAQLAAKDLIDLF